MMRTGRKHPTAMGLRYACEEGKHNTGASDAGSPRSVSWIAVIATILEKDAILLTALSK
jgi:hypothetical protein